MLKIGYSGLSGTIKGEGSGGRDARAEIRDEGETRAWNCGDVGDISDRNVRVLLGQVLVWGSDV